MTYCGKLLKNYYEKERNKIVFRNGMTLNQLAMEMWERLEYRGIDISALSRIIRGERNFTYQQLQVFCEILQIESKERKQLETSLGQAILKRHNVKADAYSIASFLRKEREVHQEVRTDKRPFYRKFPYVILIWYFIGLLWWVKLQINAQRGLELEFFGIFTNFIPLFAGIYGIRFGLKQKEAWRNLISRSIIFFSVGLLGAWFGNEVWAFYNLFLKIEIPYPSWADLGYFSVIPFYTLGVLYLARACGVIFNWSVIKNKWPALGIPIIMLLFCYFLFLKNVPVDLSKPIKIFLDFAYPLGETVPIVIVLMTIVVVNNTMGKIRERLLYVLLALVVQYIADYAFLYQAGKGIYRDGNFIDLIYTTAYVAMGLALHSFNNYNFNYVQKIDKLMRLARCKASRMILFLNKLFFPLNKKSQLREAPSSF